MNESEVGDGDLSTLLAIQFCIASSKLADPTN